MVPLQNFCLVVFHTLFILHVFFTESCKSFAFWFKLFFYAGDFCFPIQFLWITWKDELHGPVLTQTYFILMVLSEMFLIFVSIAEKKRSTLLIFNGRVQSDKDSGRVCLNVLKETAFPAFLLGIYKTYHSVTVIAHWLWRIITFMEKHAHNFYRNGYKGAGGFFLGLVILAYTVKRKIMHLPYW